jgi:hypothetical protein
MDQSRSAQLSRLIRTGQRHTAQCSLQYSSQVWHRTCRQGRECTQLHLANCTALADKCSQSRSLTLRDRNSPMNTAHCTSTLSDQQWHHNIQRRKDQCMLTYSWPLSRHTDPLDTAYKTPGQ